MTTVCSTRDFHSQLDVVCSSLEALFHLSGSNHDELVIAALPAMQAFRELLDLADSIVGPDDVEDGIS